MKKLLTGNDTLMDCLKNKFKRELHFPEMIDGFKFSKNMMKQIFTSGFCSKSWSVILKSYMNCYFDEKVIQSKVDKSRNVKFNINEDFKEIYKTTLKRCKITISVYHYKTFQWYRKSPLFLCLIYFFFLVSWGTPFFLLLCPFVTLCQVATPI